MNLEVNYKDVHVYNLNERLVNKQGLDQERVDIIKALHVEKLTLFDKMRETDDPTTLKELANSYEDIEFMMQEAWGFPKDRNYHRWWEVPKCQCPVMDNRDNYGTKYRITSGNCPIHGGVK
jgi:hypothetical protein